MEVAPASPISKEPKSSGTAKSRLKSAGKPSGATTSAATDAPATPTAPPPITLPPLFKALSEASYNYMRCLHVWGIPVNDDGAVAIVSDKLTATVTKLLFSICMAGFILRISSWSKPKGP